MAFEDWVLSHARITTRPHKRVSMEDKMAFFQQFSTLLSSGTPLLQALYLCASQSQSLVLQQVLGEVAGRVAAGSTLFEAAAEYPNVFEHHWLEVIRVGEATGEMATVLLELNKQIREARETQRKIVAALTYPIMLLLVALLAVTIMLWFVVPTFGTMFKEMGAKLPDITQVLIDASDFVVKNGPYMVAGLAVLIYAVRRYLQTEPGRRRLSGVGLTVPVLGELMVQNAMYRFAQNIALLLKSGVPLLEALEVLSGIYRSNPIYQDALRRTQARVAAGRPLAASLEETGLFAPMLTNMVRIGEESGQLVSVMEQLAPYYRERMEGLVAKLTKLLEPVIVIGMGATIAGIMLAIYLPMFEMAGKVN
jgi:type IV pilus assembly protein PilC